MTYRNQEVDTSFSHELGAIHCIRLSCMVLTNLDYFRTSGERGGGEWGE